MLGQCLLLLCGLLLIPVGQLQAVESVDDTGYPVVLDQPAHRIISLSPHVTEMLFVAGAGDRLVGAVEYSDYPPEARAIPRIGGYEQIDMERVLVLRPDLVVAWASGNGPRIIDRLRRLGLPVFVTEPADPEMIARDIVVLGELAGSSAQAQSQADALRVRYASLRERYQQRPPVKVFYEIWNSPLMTVNGQHLISRMMQLCGGRNAFGDLPTLTPALDVEGVVAADPEVIIASGMEAETSAWLTEWQRWPGIQAVKRGNLFFIPPDLLQRNGPRIIDGAERLCELLELARSRRP